MNKSVSLILMVASAAAGCGEEINPTDDSQSTAEEAVLGRARDKTKSPETDLAHFPKLPAPADLAPQVTPNLAPTSAGLARGSDDVYSVQLNDDGSGSMTIYTPPPGLTGRQLHMALREQGVAGLQDTDVVAPPDRPPYCEYGTATLFRCNDNSVWLNQIHWANSGFSHPQVYFVDHTGANWPVDASTYQWNQAHGIDSMYRSGTCPNIAGAHCVNVVDANYGNSCWQGLTTVSWDNAHNITSAKVQFNDYQGEGVCSKTRVTYQKNSYGYRQDACHELGHALGMGHNVAESGSCLYGTIMNSSSMRLPSSQDYTLIARLYATAH